MINKFAILVVKTKKGVEEEGAKVRDMKILLKNCACIRAYKACKKHTNFDKLVLRLSDYWSFFDYEILNVMVATHSPGKDDRLNKYEEDFRHFCQRRLCEVPRDGIGIKVRDRNRLRVKCDNRFSYKKTRLWDIKVLSLKLAALLNTIIALRSIKKGCILLSFTTFTDIPYPLSNHQKRELKELGILLMYNLDHEYFDAKNPNWSIEDERPPPSLGRGVENVEEQNLWTEACRLGAAGFFRERHDSTGSSSIGASPYASSFSDSSDSTDESSDEGAFLPDGRMRPQASPGPGGECQNLRIKDSFFVVPCREVVLISEVNQHILRRPVVAVEEVIDSPSRSVGLTMESLAKSLSSDQAPGSSLVDAQHPLAQSPSSPYPTEGEPPQSGEAPPLPEGLPTDLPEAAAGPEIKHSTPKKGQDKSEETKGIHMSVNGRDSNVSFIQHVRIYIMCTNSFLIL